MQTTYRCTAIYYVTGTRVEREIKFRLNGRPGEDDAETIIRARAKAHALAAVDSGFTSDGVKVKHVNFG